MRVKDDLFSKTTKISQLIVIINPHIISVYGIKVLEA